MPPFLRILVAGAAVSACASTQSSPAPDPSPPLDTATTADDPWTTAVSDQASAMAKQWPAGSVRIVVMNVESGDIVAKAGAVDESGPVGSTIKPLSVAAALDAGVAPTVMLDTGTGAQRFGTIEVRDARAHGVLSLRDAVARSSNVAIARLTEHTAAVPLYTAVHTLLGRDAQPVDEGEAIEFLYGGTAQLSPVELARAYATVANGGRDPLDDTRRITEASAAAVLEILEHAVTGEQATGSAAAVDGIRVGGKTGTARAPGHPQHTAAFVGLVPLPEPKWAIAVVVDGLDGKAFGGTVAAPAFAQLVAAVGSTPR